MSLPTLPNPNDRKRWTLLALLLLVLLPNATRASATPLTRDEIDTLLGSRTEFSRQEVAELVSNILTDAEDEIERTAQEAARAVAAVDAGEITVQRSIAESLKQESIRIDLSRGRWKKAALIEAAIIVGGALVVGLSH